MNVHVFRMRKLKGSMVGMKRKFQNGPSLDDIENKLGRFEHSKAGFRLLNYTFLNV